MPNVSRPIRTSYFSSNDFGRKPLKDFGQRNDMTDLHLKKNHFGCNLEILCKEKKSREMY